MCKGIYKGTLRGTFERIYQATLKTHSLKQYLREALREFAKEALSEFLKICSGTPKGIREPLRGFLKKP